MVEVSEAKVVHKLVPEADTLSLVFVIYVRVSPNTKQVLF